MDLKEIRRDIVTSMCYTVRHDYGLEKRCEDFSLCSGMSEQERVALYNQMDQLYDHHIEPLLSSLLYATIVNEYGGLTVAAKRDLLQGSIQRALKECGHG